MVPPNNSGFVEYVLTLVAVGGKAENGGRTALFRLYLAFARLFTLIPPMIGIFSGALIGYGASHARFALVRVGLAVLAAAPLNSASNGFNQICDREYYRFSKRHCHLPSGTITPA